MTSRVLVVIPARGGSKGIPGKNLIHCAGKPLLAWTFEHVLEASTAINAGDYLGLQGMDVGMIVSTDDPAIAAYAREWGVPVLDRPAELATDTALTAPVVAHAVEHLDKFAHARPDIVAVLQPTVPARAYNVLADCLARLIDTDADSVHTVYPLHFVWWRESAAYLYRHDTGHREPARWRSQCPRRPRRQDMDERELMYAEDGAVFVCKADLVRSTGQYIGDPRKHRVEVYETQRSIDIDDFTDLALAEALLYRRTVPMMAGGRP